MNQKLLLVIDMQNDFISGALGTKEAQAILPHVIEHVRNHQGPLMFTRDTHFENYMETQEGRRLPVPHCIQNTEGWQLTPALEALRIERQAPCIDKPAFGSPELAHVLQKRLREKGDFDSIEMIGVCTDICVLSNAMLLKAALPETNISVIGSLCAGVTPESHENALKAMAVCQVDVL